MISDGARKRGDAATPRPTVFFIYLKFFLRIRDATLGHIFRVYGSLILFECNSGRVNRGLLAEHLINRVVPVRVSRKIEQVRSVLSRFVKRKVILVSYRTRAAVNSR